MNVDIRFASVSQVGRRASNQDASCAEQLTSDIFLFAVADGMGGANGGEVASEIAIKTLRSSVLSEVETLYQEPSGIQACFKTAISNIQAAIKAEGIRHEEYKGMGTTIVAMLLVEDHFAICHIGDSRAYKWSKANGLSALTSDHSLVQESLRSSVASEVSEDFLKRHDHIITRVLDGGDDVGEISDLYKVSDLGMGSHKFVLCSDGLILDKLNSPEYISEILSIDDLDELELCKLLTNNAYEAGSKDNITVVVASIDSSLDGDQTTQISL